MKHIQLIFAGLAFAAMAIATPVTCDTKPLSVYEASGFACYDNGLTYSNFTGAPLGVILVPLAPDASHSGFDIELALYAGFDQSKDENVGWTVTADPGLLIDDAALSFNGAVQGLGAATSVVEQICLGGGPLALCDPGNLKELVVTNPPEHFSNHIFFAGVSALTVNKDIMVSGGTFDPKDPAEVSLVENLYSKIPGVPEPGTVGLIGLGLVVIGVMKRRLR